MAAYVIVEVETIDHELMQPYRELAGPSVTAAGGKFLARGGGIDVLEGDRRPQRVVVIEFDSLEHARAWWESDEYRPIKEMRLQAGHSTMIAVEGVSQ